MKVTIVIEEEAPLRALLDALDLYTRIGIGQFEEITKMWRYGRLLETPESTNRAQTASEISAAVAALKSAFGHPQNGSYGIANTNVHIDVKRAYELLKQIEKPIALFKNPNPTFRGVHYDGRILTLTKDLDITVICENS